MGFVTTNTPNRFATVSTIPQVSQADNGAGTLVREGWNSAQIYAANAFEEAINLVNELQVVGNQLIDSPNIDVQVATVNQTLSPFEMPDLPPKPAIVSNFPDAPPEPTLAGVTALALPDAPLLTATLPDINLNIVAPSPLTATPATAPTLNTVVLPDKPTINLPSVPNMLALNLPTSPTINLPTFTATLEDLIAAPNPIFSFVEPAYTSDLLTGLNTFLNQWIAGASTGLAPAIEQAIWNRGRSREDLNALKLSDTARMNYAGRGFPMPSGALAMALKDAMQDALDKSSSLSRDVMIKQAELEQQNRQFAVTQGVQLQGQLLTYANQVAQRAFEVANTTFKGTIDIFQAVVSSYNAKVQAFSTRAQVWKQQTEVELTKLEIFKTELEAQKLIGTVNLQQVEVYKAQLQGVTANIEVYKSQVESANVEATINKSYIESFVAQMQGYSELVKAKTAEYDGYATRVKAEVSKADVFKAQADAYKSQVEGYTALTNARVSEQNAEIKINQEIPLQLFNSRVQAFEKLVSAESARLGSLTAVYETDGRLYTSNVQAQASKVGAEAEVYKAETQYVLGEANVNVEIAKAEIAKITSAVSLLQEAIKAGAQVSAQLAASALSAVNLSGSISDSNSYSNSNSSSRTSSDSQSSSQSTSLSESYIHTYKE